MGTEGTAEIRVLISEFENVPPANDISEGRLNVAKRARKSLFRWSGQFPPELAEALLEKYAKPGATVLDPFSGSGTVLFEAAKRSLQCMGTDTNPMAVELSKTAMFCNVSDADRLKYINRAQNLLKNAVIGFDKSGAFPGKLSAKDYDIIKKTLADASIDELTQNILLNVLMRFFSSKEKETVSGLAGAFETHKSTVMGLPHSDAKCTALLADARKLPIKSASVNLVLTSPPYPGVFDYYKNYKRVMYLAGWKASDAARSEIGRLKDRGGKLAGLAAYAVDIHNAILEIRRVLKKGGSFLLVIGNRVEINGANVKSAELLYVLARMSGFRMITRQERRFTGRQGKGVSESILHFIPSEAIASMDFGIDKLLHEFTEMPTAQNEKKY